MVNNIKEGGMVKMYDGIRMEKVRAGWWRMLGFSLVRNTVLDNWTIYHTMEIIGRVPTLKTGAGNIIRIAKGEAITWQHCCKLTEYGKQFVEAIIKRDRIERKGVSV